MRRCLIRLAIGLATLAAVMMLVGCDEDGGPTPAVRATRQEEATFSVGDAAVIDADTSNGEVIVRGVEGAQDVHVTVTLWTRGDTEEEAEKRLDKIVYRATQNGQTIRLQSLRSA